MKKLTILLISAFMAFGTIAISQGLENFNNSNATGSYADGSFVGENGITWSYIASRDANGDANGSGINLPALMLRRSSSNSKVYSETVSGGIGDFSVKLYKGFTGGGNRQVELFINDISYGTSTVFDDFNEHVFTVSSINVPGDIVIRIDNITSKQVIVDDITWTGYSGGATPLITVTPSSLSGFSYVEGNGPSASQSFTVEGADLTDDITVAPPSDYEISLDNATYQSTDISLTQSGGTVTSTTVYTRLIAGLAAGNYNEDITMTSTGATDKTVSCSGSVEAPATTTLPYSETFDIDLGDCYTYSVSGDTKYWVYGSYGSNGYAEMNGYNSGDTEEDWLVLPGIDFDSYSNEIMTFDTWYNYGTDDANNYLKLYYSADYPGIGDPSGYTWTEISFTQGAANAWTSSGTIDLSSITGTAVYLAFKYHYEAGNYRHWEVDNISITPSVPVDVTFQVNMANETVSADGIHVAGSFNWDPAATLMTDPDGDNIYTVTVSNINSNTEIEFKYLNGNAWGTEETVPSGCQKPGTTNRYEYVTAPYDSIPVVCFSSCTDCGGNWYDITFQVDMQNETVSGDGVYLAGTFTNWGTNALPMTQNGTVWSTTVSLQENSPEEYKFVNGDPNNGGAWESINNRTLTVPSANTTLDLVCFNSYDACPLVTPDLIISEVADPGDFYKGRFVELYNAGSSNVDLSNIYLVKQTNGGTFYDIALTGSVLPGETYVIAGYSADFNTYYGFVADQSNGDINGNGDDGYFLYINGDHSTGTLVDAYGVIDEDGTGEPWEYTNSHAVRHRDVTTPNDTWTASEWTIVSADVDDMTPKAHSATRTWQGTTSSAWQSKGDNWDGTYGYIPDASDNVDIPNVAKAAFPVISGTVTCASLTMASGSSLDISPSGALTVLGTFANNGGNLTIKSDATGTGSLIENNGVNATTERFLSMDKWHYVATPVDNANTGVYTGLYMMYWDEPAWLWKWVLSADSTLAVDMQGYALWSNGADATVSYTGALNTGTKTINLTNTPGTPNPDDYSGFNLVGNPFPSSLNWNNDDGSGWTRTNMDMTVWVWNQGTGNYGSYVKDAATGTNGVDSILAPQQGFMVHCNSTSGGSLSVDNTARVHSSKDILKAGKSAEGQYLLLKVEGNGYSDEVMISQDYNSSYNFDINDGLKLYGRADAPQLYTISSDGEKLSVNSIPALATSNLTIPMNFRAGVDGEFTITLNDIEGFDNTPLYLEDLQLGTISEITNDFVYNFKASADDAENRFLLHFSDVETPPVVNGGASMLTNVSIYSYDKTIYLFSKENISGIVNVYDLTGKIVMQKEINGSSSGMIKDNSLRGFYIVTLMTNDGFETQKVYIK